MNSSPLTSTGLHSFDGASTGRLMRDQPTWDIHAADSYAADGSILLARGGHLSRNNAYAKAMINAMQNGVCGPHGLLFKSLYDSEQNDSVCDEDRAFRRKITKNIRRGLRHVDAAGLLTFRQWEDSLVFGKAVHGEAIKVRVRKPRPYALYETAWRTIHPARVSNPEWGPNTDRFQNGVVLDSNGDPIGLSIQNCHPTLVNAGVAKWQTIPLIDENGIEQVIWHSARIEPEQFRAPGWFAPIMGLLVNIGKVTEAHVVGTRLKACLGMIMEVDDPVAAAKKDQNGTVWTTNTMIEPGKTYYVKKGTVVKEFQFNFQGDAYEAFTNALLQAVTAAFGPGIPYQFVLQQLTKSNMASARAALMQAWRSFRREQIDHEHELRIVVKNYILEDLARSRLILPTGDDLEAACAGFFVPPQRLSSDEYRELQAAQLKRDVLNVSKSTLSREYGGYDHDDEIAQTAEDNDNEKRSGLRFPVVATANPIMNPDPNAETDTEETDDADEELTVEEMDLAA